MTARTFTLGPLIQSFFTQHLQGHKRVSPQTLANRDRGKPHDFPPPTPPGIRGRTRAVRLGYMVGEALTRSSPLWSKKRLFSAIRTPGV
jgi:hypothetical protein